MACLVPRRRLPDEHESGGVPRPHVRPGLLVLRVPAIDYYYYSVVLRSITCIIGNTGSPVSVVESANPRARPDTGTGAPYLHYIQVLHISPDTPRETKTERRTPGNQYCYVPSRRRGAYPAPGGYIILVTPYPARPSAAALRQPCSICHGSWLAPNPRRLVVVQCAGIS